jgi:hypothetical protein
MRPEVPSQTALRYITPRPIPKSVRFPSTLSLRRPGKPVKGVRTTVVTIIHPAPAPPVPADTETLRAGL